MVLKTVAYISVGSVKFTKPTNLSINHGRFRKATPTLPNNINRLHFLNYAE
jgi:hypothetical protein